MAAAGEDAYCTLLTSDGYLPGAMVLARSLRDAGTKKKVAVMVTVDSMSPSTLEVLKKVYDYILPVERIVNKNPANLYLMHRPDLISVFTKIQLWRQIQFRRAVYVDADMVCIRAPDELFERASMFAAAPDIGWPDCFNSGLMALTPNMGDYYALLALAERGISFDGADQGLLNMHFTNYDRISFSYNCTPSAHYQYAPAYRHFQSTISMVHFIGDDKPWRVGRESGGTTGAYSELLGRWWAVYDKHYRLPATATYSGQASNDSWTVQQYVQGEPRPTGYGSSSAPSKLHVGQGPPEVLPPGRPIDGAGDVGHEPAPPVQAQTFSAPFSDWDPAKEAPPPNARPEAANFALTNYIFNESRDLFQPPKYAEPPKDLHYQVPDKRSPERPAPLFPWEQNQTPPTRVFADTPTATSASAPAPGPRLDSPEFNDELAVSADEAPPPQPLPVPQLATPPTGFDNYARTNAWDEDAGITKYMEAVQRSRFKGQVQVIQSSDPKSDIMSPTGDRAPGRRPSMKLTDFPTEIERPSLPVTPAPIRSHKFWGAERDGSGGLPQAEGVPAQQHWDPNEKLEELRRSSIALAASDAPPGMGADLPQRSFPGSSTLLPTAEETDVPQTGVVGGDAHRVESARPTSTTRFNEPGYGAGVEKVSGDDDLMSLTDT